jgi:hypothetical protein
MALTAGQKAAATKAARKAEALAANLKPVTPTAGFHAYVCPRCERVTELATPTAEVWHRCPAFGLKPVTAILAQPPATKGGKDA